MEQYLKRFLKYPVEIGYGGRNFKWYLSFQQQFTLCLKIIFLLISNVYQTPTKLRKKVKILQANCVRMYNFTSSSSLQQEYFQRTFRLGRYERKLFQRGGGRCWQLKKWIVYFESLYGWSLSFGSKLSGIWILGRNAMVNKS